MRIGELAARTGVSTRLLRYYEQQGLLKSHREANGYRSYSEGAVERIEQVRGLIDAGLPTEVIRDMVPCLEECVDPLEAPVIARELAEALATRRTQLQQRIACLSKNDEAIARYLERATITD